ncbi:MAG TPA: Xaa-Pro peptidase family protein [Candidatus Saccharimonadales bacterium]|nr:Xaa-Pro peptidase family protein [Candidatus Saccharimonadales bacterium]
MFRKRIEKVEKLLAAKKLEGMLISSVSNIFYLTGFSNFSKDEREAYLFITPKNTYIFTDARYAEAVAKEVPHFQLHIITAKTPFITLLKNICKKDHITSLGFEEDNITVWEYKRLQTVIPTLIPTSLHLRMQKDTEEIKKIQKACDMGDKAFSYALSHMKQGVSEKYIQVQIELFLKQQNADVSFRPIVAFGSNASMPHYESSPERKLRKNECILIDMGAKVTGYCSDMTRTIFFGKPTSEQKKIHQVVLDSQKKAIEYLKGQMKKGGEIRARDVDKISRDYIISKGYPSIPHSLGHGIGIDVHELPGLTPNSDLLLRTGMVFSIEPGIYLPDFMGVRIEDLVVLEQKTLKILTLSERELVVL